ncbi:MAG TPA: hypothetical protein VEU08_15530, partial [Vicinamibacterales bacterium]|nr:hypothetical protein [Vicinamibacterales bacterium]
SIPRLDAELDQLPVIQEDGSIALTSWRSLVIATSAETTTAAIAMRAVTAIVINQDCDNIRSPDITLCEIRDFRTVEKMAKDAKTAKAWVSIVTKQARVNQKWFYLPADPTVGFDTPMGVDFQGITRVRREDIDAMRTDFRVGRVDGVALDHFRERLSEFFRRYAYDEWYPLTKEQFDAYRAEKPEPIKPYDWQNGTR